MEVGMREVARNIDEIIYIVSEPLSSSPVSTPFSKRSLPFFPLSLPPFYNLIFPSSLSLFLFLAKFLFIVRFLLRFILEVSCQSYTHIPTFYLSRVSSSTSVYAPHPSWFLRFPSPFREEKNPPTLWRSFPSFAFSSRFFNEKKKKRETVSPFYPFLLYSCFAPSRFSLSPCTPFIDAWTHPLFRVSSSLLSQYFRSLM